MYQVKIVKLSEFIGRLKSRLKSLIPILIMLKNPLSIAGLVVTVSLFSAMVLAPFIAPYDPIKIVGADRLQSPSKLHLFGTDEFGRDIFSRVIYGTRISLFAALVTVLLTVSTGVTVGVVSGYFGGRVDDLLMRLTDVILAFPSLVLAMAIAAALGPSLFNSMTAITLSWWPQYARLARGQTLYIKSNEYVTAAKAIGESAPRIMLRHIFPNIFSPIIVKATMDIGVAVLWSSSLSFIGLGTQPPTPEWGRMIMEGRNYLKDAWWIPTSPGLAIVTSVMGFNLLGDFLRDLLDPRHKM